MKILKNYPYVPYPNELTDRLENTRQTRQPWNFIAITSKTISEIGPAIRFYGGAPTTGITPCAPSMGFDVFGNCEVVIGDWMNEDNCPNAFDPRFVATLTRFVQNNLPILCLLHLQKLTVSDVMDFFTGRDCWEVMLSGIRDIPEYDYLKLQYAATPYDLHRMAFEMGLYVKQWGGITMEEFTDSLCPRIQSAVEPIYEETWDNDEWMLIEYRGRARSVSIPEDVLLIGVDVFAGHTEIEQVRFPKACYGICERAFAGCINLQKVFLPDACDLIGMDAFAECRGLKQLILPPRGIIESGAFQNCSGLRIIDIQEGISEIGEDAFLGCNNLIIRCKENSCAHIYAQEHGILFELYA